MKLTTTLFTLLCLFRVSQTFAFTLSTSNGAAFNIDGVDEIRINVEDGGGTCNLGLTPNEILDMALVAADRFWNRAPTSALKLGRGDVVNVASFESADLCSPDSPCTPTATFKHSMGLLIGCNENTSNFPTNSILGLSVPTVLNGKNIQTANVLLNGTSGSRFLSLSYDEQIATIAHEMGHALGLGHSPVNDSLMYYQSVPVRNDLGADDINGISYLYPKTQVVDLNCGSLPFDPRQGPKPPGGGLAILLGAAMLYSLYKRSKHSA